MEIKVRTHADAVVVSTWGQPSNCGDFEDRGYATMSISMSATEARRLAADLLTQVERLPTKMVVPITSKSPWRRDERG